MAKVGAQWAQWAAHGFPSGSASLKDRGAKPAFHIRFPTVGHAGLMVGGGELPGSSFTV